MIRLLLWLALMVTDFAAMAAIIWIERVYSVPQVWLGLGNFLIFGTLLMAIDVGIYIPINRRIGLLHRRKPSTMELLLRAVLSLLLSSVYALTAWQSSEPMERFLVFIAVIGGSLSAYASVRDVIKRHRQRWT